MEPSMLLEAFKGLVAAGPVSVVLGILCYALWQQNQRHLTRLERQHEKMLKLAVRVQRAVETIAGLHSPTEIEEVLEEDEKNRRRTDEEDDPRPRQRD